MYQRLIIHLSAAKVAAPGLVSWLEKRRFSLISMLLEETDFGDLRRRLTKQTTNRCKLFAIIVDGPSYRDNALSRLETMLQAYPLSFLTLVSLKQHTKLSNLSLEQTPKHLTVSNVRTEEEIGIALCFLAEGREKIPPQEINRLHRTLGLPRRSSLERLSDIKSPYEEIPEGSGFTLPSLLPGTLWPTGYQEKIPRQKEESEPPQKYGRRKQLLSFEGKSLHLGRIAIVVFKRLQAANGTPKGAGALAQGGTPEAGLGTFTQNQVRNAISHIQTALKEACVNYEVIHITNQGYILEKR